MKLRPIIALCTCLVFFTPAAKAQENNIPVVKLFDKEYYKYEVQASETLYGLSRRFNVSQEEIIAMNPFLIEGLKTGQILLIPVRIFEPDKDELPEKTPDNSAEKSQEKTPGKSCGKSSQKSLKPNEDSLSAASDSSVLFEKWEYEYYTVEKWRENLSDIADNFGVDIDEIRLHNPNVPDRLPRGSLLMIPIKKIEVVSEIKTAEEEPSEDLEPKIFRKPNIALLLPFMLDDTTANSIERYVEFYEGVLMAADSLKQLNFSFELSVFDTVNSNTLGLIL